MVEKSRSIDGRIYGNKLKRKKRKKKDYLESRSEISESSFRSDSSERVVSRSLDMRMSKVVELLRASGDSIFN